MLRIFFEEFRNLKKEKEENMTKTRVKQDHIKVENKLKSNTSSQKDKKKSTL